MICIRANLERLKFFRLLFFAALTLITACSVTPDKGVGDKVVIDSLPGKGRVASPNPYLDSKRSVPDAVKRQFLLAKQAVQRKDWSQAEKILTAVSQKYPKLSGVHLNLGYVYKESAVLDKAEVAFLAAIEANHLNVNAYNALAILYREQGKFVQSEQQYLAALKVWPDSAESHRNIGILYDLYLGRFSDAMKHYELYRQLQGKEDKMIRAWIADLKNRMAEQA